MLAVRRYAGPAHRYAIVSCILFALGLDPPGFKLRAASGFEAADFFVAGIPRTYCLNLNLGYWIWNKVLASSHSVFIVFI